MGHLGESAAWAVKGDNGGNPALSKWSLGFNPWLVLGSPWVEVQ